MIRSPLRLPLTMGGHLSMDAPDDRQTGGWREPEKVLTGSVTSPKGASIPNQQAFFCLTREDIETIGTHFDYLRDWVKEHPIKPKTKTISFEISEEYVGSVQDAIRGIGTIQKLKVS